MRHRTWISVLVLVAGCGPALDEPMEGRDDDWRLNQVEGVRQATATCPNGGNMSPTTPSFDAAIDGYAAYAGQTTCDPTTKPGVVAFRDLVLATYPCTSDSGITRACSTGSISEHKEGRAWDWGLTYPHPAATALLDWLLATDGHGSTHAMARRLGIMYVIWNNQVWKSYQASKGWQAYTGSSSHTDHVHFSFSWDGANKATTFWTAGTTPPPPPPPSNHAPIGNLDGANCAEIWGWAQDPDAPAASVVVEIAVDGTVLHQVNADIYRANLCGSLGSCNHGYRVGLPAPLKDNKPHVVRIHAVDSNDGTRSELAGSPRTVTCSSTTPPPAPGSDGSVGPAPIQPDGGAPGSDGELLVPGQSGQGGSYAPPSVSGHVLQGGGCSVASDGQPPSLSLLALLLLVVRRR